MKQRKISEEVGKDYLKALETLGPNTLCDELVKRGLDDSIKNPELDLLEFAEAFFLLYRRTENYSYAEIGKVIRRAAHIVYRELLKKDKNKAPNHERFLTLINNVNSNDN